MHVLPVVTYYSVEGRMDPERVLQELLALEDSSESEPISLPATIDLDREVLSSDDGDPEVQADFELPTTEGTSFNETGHGSQDYYDTSLANEMDTSYTQVRLLYS